MKNLFVRYRFNKWHLNSGHGRLTYTPFHTDPSEHSVIITTMSLLYQNDSMISLWCNHDLITLCLWDGIWEVVSWLGFVCFSIYFHISRGCWVHLIYLVPNGVHHPGGQVWTTTLEPYHLIESLQLILWFGIARFHLLASYLFNIGTGNGLTPIRCQASTWANVCSLLIKFLLTNLEQFWIKIYWFISRMYLKMMVCKMAAMLFRLQYVKCPSHISHNAPFRTEMCTFLFWMVYYEV